MPPGQVGYSRLVFPLRGPGKTQDLLERLNLSAGLRKSWCTPGWTDRGGVRDGWRDRWMDGRNATHEETKGRETMIFKLPKAQHNIISRHPILLWLGKQGTSQFSPYVGVFIACQNFQDGFNKFIVVDQFVMILQLMLTSEIKLT